MKQITIPFVFSILGFFGVAHAEECIIGADMVMLPTRDDVTSPDKVTPQEPLTYEIGSTSISLSGTPNPRYAMFLYVPNVGDWVYDYDWEYCPQSRTIHFLREERIITRNRSYVYDGSVIWVSYAPKTH